MVPGSARNWIVVRHQPPTRNEKNMTLLHLTNSISRPSWRYGFLLLTLACFVLGPTTAGAFPNLYCSYRDQTTNGEVDFGSGNHSGGYPAFGSIRWSYASVNGVNVVTVRVKGTLYLDQLGSGCARIKIFFQDSNFNNLQESEPIAFCGPGGNANNTRINVPSP